MTSNSKRREPSRSPGRPPNKVPSIHWRTTITANPADEPEIVEILEDAPENISRSDYVKSLFRDALKLQGDPEQVLIDVIGLEEGADDDLIEFIESRPPGVSLRSHIATALRKGASNKVEIDDQESDSLTDGLMNLLG